MNNGQFFKTIGGNYLVYFSNPAASPGLTEATQIELFQTQNPKQISNDLVTK